MAIRFVALLVQVKRLQSDYIHRVDSVINMSRCVLFYQNIISLANVRANP